MNCLDSIDRTNVAISQIGITVLQKQLVANGIDVDLIFGEGVSKNGIAFMKIDSKFISDIKAMWRETGDALSKQYTGTDSTISGVSEKLKEGFWGKINHKITSAQRLVKNTMTNNHNQAVIEIILGKDGN